MERDYYSEARDLASQLRSDAGSLAELAAGIEEAIDSGFTATEILMGVKFRLGQLLEQPEANIPAARRVEARDLLEAIDEALR